MAKIEGLIDDIRNGRLTEDALARRQRKLDDLEDVFEIRTADEDTAGEEQGEQHEEFEDEALGGTIAVNLVELEAERRKVQELLDKSRGVFAAGEESRFEKLREVLRDPEYLDENNTSTKPQFGNSAMHADWEKVTEPDVSSVIGFVEHFLLSEFAR